MFISNLTRSCVYFEIGTVLKPRMLGNCYHTYHIYFVILYECLINLCAKKSAICFHKCYELFVILKRQKFLII